MTTSRRNLLATALTAAGLMLAGGVAQAAAPDVSTIYGRASPPNGHITASTPSAHEEHAGARANEENYDTSVSSRDMTVYGNDGTAAVDPVDPVAPQTYPEHASRTVHPGEQAQADAVADGTGRIHEEPLDGTPLVDGRGLREGVDPYAGAPVQTEPAFDVADILGRSSPPAPEEAPPIAERG